MKMVIRPAGVDDVTRIEFAEPGVVEDLLQRPEAQCVVAELGEHIIGYACAWTAVVHPARRWLEVAVQPHHRSQGIGRALVSQLDGDNRWFAARMIAGASAEGFVLALGGSPYQSSPPLLLQGRKLRSSAKVLSHQHHHDVRPGSDFDDDELARLWLQQYLWVHRDWSPVGESEEVQQLLLAEAQELDRELTSVALVDGEPVAVCFGFADPVVPTLVAETVERDTPDGIEAVRAAVGRSLAVAVERDLDRVEFDGHESDPHFAVVANTLPLTGDQIVLYEIPAVQQ